MVSCFKLFCLWSLEIRALLAKATPGNQRESLNNLFQSIKTVTAKEDLLYHFKNLLLLQLARKNQYPSPASFLSLLASPSSQNHFSLPFPLPPPPSLPLSWRCNKVFLADNGTRLAIRVIAFTSKGRGYTLPFETCFSDKRFPDVTFLRPMKEILAKEVGIYNHYRNISSLILPDFCTKSTNPKLSIDFLTECFYSFPCGSFHVIGNKYKSISK